MIVHADQELQANTHREHANSRDNEIRSEISAVSDNRGRDKHSNEAHHQQFKKWYGMSVIHILQLEVNEQDDTDAQNHNAGNNQTIEEENLPFRCRDYCAG